MPDTKSESAITHLEADACHHMNLSDPAGTDYWENAYLGSVKRGSLASSLVQAGCLPPV